MIGEICAVGSSVVTALAVVLSKKLTSGIAALPFQTVRCWFGALFILIIFFLLGRAPELIGIRVFLMVLMSVSLSIGIVVGDTLYLKALALTDASRVFPVVKVGQVIPTAIIGSMLDEAITLPLMLGAVFIIGGASLVTAMQTRSQSKTAFDPTDNKKWVLLCIVAGICWTISIGMMKIVLREIDPVLAGAFRLPFAALLMTGWAIGSGQGKGLRIIQYGWVTVGLLVVAGILSYGFGVMFALYAVKFAGITRSAVLTSWTPIFIMLLAFFLLKEKLTLQSGLGVLVSSLGTILILSF